MKIEKSKNPNRLTVRDVVTIAIGFVLMLLVYLLASPIGFNPKTYLFIHPICSLFWGTLFLLVYTKVNKNFVPLIFSTVIALVSLPYHIGVALFIFSGGIIAEILWRKMDRKKIKTMGIVFVIQIFFWYLGVTLPLIFMLEKMRENAPEYSELFGSIGQVITPQLELLGILALLVGCLIGLLIGKKILKKHFEKAGIVS